MIRKFTILTALTIFITLPLLAQAQKPETAESILNKAAVTAKSSDKNVFLIFHASWCSWCKKLEKAMESPELKKIFEDNFVITHLDVLEREEKIELLENPGAHDEMVKFEGAQAGLPFYVFLDSGGKMIVNSNAMPKNQNIGYPGSKEEVEAFTRLLKTSSAHISDKELASISDYFIKAIKPAKQKEN